MQAKRRREIFWRWTPENLALDQRWRTIAKRAEADAGEVVTVDVVMAWAGQLWSIAGACNGAVEGFDAETLAVAIGISDKAAEAIERALARKGIVVDGMLVESGRLATAAKRPCSRRDRISCCKAPADLALDPHWAMIAETHGVRTGLVVALMHWLWSVAGRNLGSVAEFDEHAKLFAHIFKISAEMLARLRQALVDEGVVFDQMLVDFDWLAGTSPEARRKRCYDRRNQRRCAEQEAVGEASQAEPRLCAVKRHDGVSTALPAVAAAFPATPPPAPPPEDSEKNTPLEPPVGGPAPGWRVFRIDEVEILPPDGARDEARAASSFASPAASGSAAQRQRQSGEAAAGQRRGSERHRSADRRRRPRPTCHDGPATDGARSHRAGASGPIRAHRPGPADIDDYAPSAETLAWADVNAPEVDARDPETIEAFRDECRATRKRCPDLDAGYRRYIRREVKFRWRGRPSPHPPKPARRSFAAAAFAAAVAAERGWA